MERSMGFGDGQNGTDQAEALRHMMQRLGGALPRASESEQSTAPEVEPVLPVTPTVTEPPRTITLVSGKGGVGKSTIALNLAISFAERGERVAVLDVNRQLAHLDLLCGRSSSWTLTHVLTMGKRIEEVAVTGPAGITLLTGCREILNIPHLPDPLRSNAEAELLAWERRFDRILIDLGTGFPRGLDRGWLEADASVLVTTPDPVAIADVYASLKSIAGHFARRGVIDATPEQNLQNVPIVLVNQARSELQVETVGQRLQETAHRFLRLDLPAIVGVPLDDRQSEAVLKRCPLRTLSPASPLSSAVDHLSRSHRFRRRRLSDSPSLFTRLLRSSEDALSPSAVNASATSTSHPAA